MMSDKAASSLLVIVLDTNPVWWGENLNVAQSSSKLSLSQCVDAVMVFANAHLMLGHHNQLAVIAAHTNQSEFLYPREEAAAAVETGDGDAEMEQYRQVDGKYELFGRVNAQIQAQIQQLVLQGLAGELYSDSLIAGPLSMALCYIHRMEKESGSGLVLTSRILVIKGSEDNPTQYMNFMNAVFTAQKQNVVVDACILDNESGLLQQACDITGGIYLKVPQMLGLLQYLLVSMSSLTCWRCPPLPVGEYVLPYLLASMSSLTCWRVCPPLPVRDVLPYLLESMSSLTCWRVCPPLPVGEYVLPYLLESMSSLTCWRVCPPLPVGQYVLPYMLESMSSLTCWRVCPPLPVGGYVLPYLLVGMSSLTCWKVCPPLPFGGYVLPYLLDSMSSLTCWTVCPPLPVGEYVLPYLLDSWYVLPYLLESMSSSTCWWVCPPLPVGQYALPHMLVGMSSLTCWTVCPPLPVGQYVLPHILESMSSLTC
ncbi:uncharacterized protein LOC125372128 [Haliotis rufescens]|uniref:uncharacterized protein LOC125372128 n=1 Tax=Haliotis rufescens TaxID=6454 RepID=UPI00201EB79F|nr:uncharacterized protein LOC125372128 [Haliotis rufescens]